MLKIMLVDIVSEVELTVCFTRDFLWPVDSSGEAWMTVEACATPKVPKGAVEVSSMRPIVIDGDDIETSEV